jgi:phospholipid/cholesterol/gamma-HCH transport system permease protein
VSDDAPALEVDWSAPCIRLVGNWSVRALAPLERSIAGLSFPRDGAVRIDGGAVTRLDTAGAYLIERLRRRALAGGATVELTGFDARRRELLRRAAERPEVELAVPAPEGFVTMLGRFSVELVRDGIGLVGFLGELCFSLRDHLALRQRFRWNALGAQLQITGPGAVPIVMLLSFLVGIVIAYQGGVQLSLYGANAFIVELVTITSVRELSPLLASIIIAGRTGAAFAAEIATMNVSNEVDALRTMGIQPMAALVVPRVIGLTMALPLLTVCADIASVGGGMVMAALMLDVSPAEFIQRVPQAVSVQSFTVGIVKTPVFAAIVAIIGCYQGFQANQGAASVGFRTTISVVHGIFLIIVADALFSIFFSLLGI